MAVVRDGAGTFSIAGPYTVAFLTPDAGHTPALRPGPEAGLPESADRWLWQLASRSAPEDFPIAPEITADEFDQAVRISAGWSATVLRHGDESPGHLLIALGLSVAATAAALTTRYGRLVLSSLRGGAGLGPG